MWVRTTNGKLVNLADAREIHLEPSFEYTPKEAVKMIAVFPPSQFVLLAAVVGDEMQEVETNANALYQGLMEKIRDNESFYDLKGGIS
jgi:hypothetical protein